MVSHIENVLLFLDSDIMLALDSRAFDRVAKDFLQKEKKKL